MNGRWRPPGESPGWLGWGSSKIDGLWDAFACCGVRTGAVSWEVRLGLADEQDGAQDISRVRLVKFLRSHTLDGAGGHDGRRVDDDINLQLARLGVGRELGLARVDDGLRALWRADVGAAGHGRHVVLRGQLLRELGRRLVGRLGQVADEHIGALLGQVRGDGGTDTCDPLSVSPPAHSALLFSGSWIIHVLRAAPVTMASLPS